MGLARLVTRAPSQGDSPPSPFPVRALPLPRPDGRPAGGMLRWTGAAGLRLDLDGKAIAFDPFVTRPGVLAVLFRRPRLAADLAAERFGNVDAVFVGHTHYDHAMDLPAVADAAPRALLHGSRTTVELCRRLGIGSERLVEVEDGGRHDFGPFTVEAVASDHARVPILHLFDRIELERTGLPRTPLRYPRGAVFAWRVCAGGLSFHIQGSAGIDEAALARQAPVDVLIACLASRSSTPRYLERLAEVLRPRVLVPFHHDDFFRPLRVPPRPVPGLDWPAFLEDAGRLKAAWDTRLWLPPFDRPVTW